MADSSSPAVASASSSPAAAADDDALAVVPSAAIRWLALHCPSNVELAALSNVNRSWRSVVASAIRFASRGERSPTEEEEGPTTAEGGGGGGGSDAAAMGRTTDVVAPPLSTLLLPAMATELSRRARTAAAEARDRGGGDGNVPRSAGAAAAADSSSSCCLAWFPPSGIQILSVRLKGERGDGDEYGSASSDSESSSYEGSYSGSASSSGGGSESCPSSAAAASSSAGTAGGGGGGGGKGPTTMATGGEGFAPGGVASYEGSEPEGGGGGRDGTERRRRRRRVAAADGKDDGTRGATAVARGVGRGMEMARSGRGGGGGGGGGRRQTCSHEWRGYRDAVDVLWPFGYATAFVRDVLASAAETATATSSPGGDVVASAGASNPRIKPPSLSHSPTFAVPGATLARPDGYCLCWDGELDDRTDEITARAAPASSSAASSSSFSPRDEESKYRRRLRLDRSRNARRARRRRRRALQRETLPRMVGSTRHKNPHLLRRQSSSTLNFDSPDDPIPPNGSSGGRRQRSLQFLNADGTLAVRVRTPKFENGLQRGPITVFVVAIATEDGCFLSGLDRRCELGHLYPSDNRDALIDMSPLALATDVRAEANEIRRRRALEAIENDLDASGRSLSSRSSHRRLYDGGQRQAAPDSDDSSDESGCVADAGRIKCRCAFCPAASSDDDDADAAAAAGGSGTAGTTTPSSRCADEPAEEADVVRGVMGPGLWHCYAAVFDGQDSVLRVDGVEEPIVRGGADEEGGGATSGEPGMGLLAGVDDDDDEGCPAALDGLTIGSDHCFDMSLCYGQGSDGEGEGAVSEVAVFRGRMPLEDIQRMERYLMKKHGLTPPPTTPWGDVSSKGTIRSDGVKIGSPHKEDAWRRQAHALIVQPPPWKLTGEPVPLRVAASHRSVAWHRTNDVTGQVVRVPRIGSKFSTGSSDW